MNSIMELFLNSGYFGYFIAYLTAVIFLASTAILFIRHKFLIVLLGGANTVWLGVGYFGYYINNLQLQEALLHVNPDEFQEMLLQSTPVVEAPLHLAGYALIPLIVLLVLNILVYSKYPAS